MIEYRITGLARDGGRLAREGPDPDELMDGLEASGYRVARIEQRDVSEWEQITSDRDVERAGIDRKTTEP